MNAFEDLRDIFMNIQTKNPWEDTPVAKYYLLNPAAKGSKGEEIVSAILTRCGFIIAPRTNPGHDRLINGVKTEIKFGLAVERNMNYGCIFNHIGMKKDWEQIIFVCVNGDGKIKATLYSKDNIPMELLQRQQGGDGGDNDDFMVNINHSFELLSNQFGNVIIP